MHQLPPPTLLLDNYSTALLRAGQRKRLQKRREGKREKRDDGRRREGEGSWVTILFTELWVAHVAVS